LGFEARLLTLSRERGLPPQHWNAALVDYDPAASSWFAWAVDARRLVDGRVVIALAAPTDVARALGAGATDVACQQATVSELVGRVIGRMRADVPERCRLTYGSLSVDARGLRAVADGRTLRFRPAEMKILVYLLRHQGEVVGAKELVLHALGANGDGGSARMHVLELRRKLASASLERILESVPGGGYRIARIDGDDCRVAPT
jgi:two-component system OmpR family response regulator